MPKVRFRGAEGGPAQVVGAVVRREARNAMAQRVQVATQNLHMCMM